MLPRNLAICKKVVDEIEVALSFMGDADLDSFLSNELLKRAVCMTVVNIGELIKNLDYDFRAKYAFVPWKAIAGFRDIAAHKYQTLRMDDVYETVRNDFPALREMLGSILKEEPEDFENSAPRGATW